MKLVYKHVSKIIQLLESELSRIESRQNKRLSDYSKLTGFPAVGERQEEDDFMATEKRESERDRATVGELLTMFDSLLEEVDFNLDVGSKFSVATSRTPARSWPDFPPTPAISQGSAAPFASDNIVNTEDIQEQS